MAKGEPDVDPAAQHVWEWFWDINQGRQYGMSGALPLSAAEFQAWANLTGNVVRREEWQVMRDMDAAYLHAANNRDGNVRAESVPEPGTGRDLNAAAFDAVFG